MTGPAVCLRARGAAAFALVVTLGAAGAAALLAPAAAPATPRIFPICIEMGGQAGPDISHGIVVWTDNRNGNLDIYGRDLATKRNVVVCRNVARQDNPSVTRTLVGSERQFLAVWVDDRHHRGTTGATDILGRNLTTKADFVVKRSASIKWFPDVVDNWVVWVEADDAAGPYRIMARDLVADTTHRIATSRILSPVGLTRRTAGGAVRHTAVYASARGDISGRDLPSGTPFNVSQTSRFEWSPDISGNRVVWWEEGGRVMLKNLENHRRRFVALGARPRVDGRLVVWDGGGRGGTFALSYTRGAAVYVRDVSRGRTVKIAQKYQTCLFPAVSGRTVVWETGPARRIFSHTHIYGTRLR